MKETFELYEFYASMLTQACHVKDIWSTYPRKSNFFVTRVGFLESGWSLKGQTPVVNTKRLLN